MSHSNRDRIVAKVQNMLDSKRYHANPNDQSIAMLKHIFRIELVEHRTIWSKKYDYITVSLSEPENRRSVIYNRSIILCTPLCGSGAVVENKTAP
ncbi:hypothetical protein NVP1031O_050 [Vibrio phage 1.031.O._10N.261.46.F8]|nr:hypothetical protein NVP1031O_050 [Vibrio phage 1.031.O._10N.261.46.F8]